MANDYLKTLKVFQRKLTNLGGKNKSLLQLRLSKSQDIDLDDLDFLLKNSSFELINQLLARKKKIALCKELDPRDEKTNNASKRLKHIFRKDKFLFEENGNQDLYLGWPYIEGKFANGTAVRCPLLYFPITLQVENEEWRLALKKDIDISFNKTFLLAYAQFNDIKLSEELLEYDFSAFKNDSITFRQDLYKLLKESPLEINFNQDLFRDHLDRFVEYNKTDYTFGHQNGVLKLMPNAVIGVFAQSSSYLIPDYEALIKKNNYNSLAELFEAKAFTDDQEKNHGFSFLKKIKEEQLITPLPIDASQENALKALKKGNSMVVQGPPGTGKSQLICNIVADYISRGKKVLVICQKRAALDVVYKRLAEINVAPFVGLVHDHKEDRVKLFEQLSHQITALKDYESLNSSYDAIQKERDFLKCSRSIDTLLDDFEAFKDALFDEAEYGLSVKDLYLTCQKVAPQIDLTQQYKQFDATAEKVFASKIETIEKFETRYNFNHPWFERVSFANFDLQDYNTIHNHLSHIGGDLSSFEEDIALLVGNEVYFEDTFWLLNRKEALQNMFVLLENDQLFEFYQQLLSKAPDKEWLLLQEAQINAYFREEGIELSTPSKELNHTLEVVQEAKNARKTPWGIIKWKLFNKDKFIVKRLLKKNNLQGNRNGFKRLTQLLDNRLNLEHKLSLFKEKEWLVGAPTPNKTAIEDWFHQHFVVIQAIEDTVEIASYLELFGFKTLNRNTCQARVNALIKRVEKFHSRYSIWRNYFTEGQIREVHEEPEKTVQLQQSLEIHFDNIVLFDGLLAKLQPAEKEVLQKLKEGDFSTQEKVNTFTNGNRYAWINHIEKKYPILKMVSSDLLAMKEQEIKELLDEKAALSLEILHAKLREQTYNNIAYNRLNNRVSYRALEHQVTKRRRLFPLRKILTDFSDEVYQLIPCWLASPEAVSSIFPLQKDFDLVIFDEASQCYAEKSLPAIERANQVMITGDAQQLSPNDLYQIRFDEEDEDLIETQKESLLDLASQFLPQVMLMGHYRSNRPELIAFSNHHFYKDKLQVIPSPEDQNSAIKYHYLPNGIWHKNTNKEEAQYVVTLATTLLSNGVSSIGVVTFNYKQQQLIEDLLDVYAVVNEITLPPTLFVKNIENVQGDEREHIIFSITYAKNLSGKISAHFGSLNQEHGEKRLNVAVSRAKKSIQVVSSLLPHELQTENTQHTGPKLLKEYLNYAFECSRENKTQLFETPPSRRLKLADQLKPMVPKKVKIEAVHFADLKIIEDQKRTLLLTDDNLYYESISAKDAHYGHQEKLIARGWNVTKQFSRNYWFNRKQVIFDLKQQK